MSTHLIKLLADITISVIKLISNWEEAYMFNFIP